MLFASSNASSLPQLIVATACAAFCLWLCFRCLANGRRKKTQHHCAWSLSLFLSGASLAIALLLIDRLILKTGNLAAVGVWLVALLSIPAIILAIYGLRQYSRKKNAWDRGRLHAWGTVLLGGAGLASGGTLLALQHEFGHARIKAALLGQPGVALLAAARTKDAHEAVSPTNGSYRLPHPDGEWILAPSALAARVSNEADAVFVTGDFAAFFAAASGPLPPDLPTDKLESLNSLQINVFRLGCKGLKILSQNTLQAGGVAFMHNQMEAELKDTPGTVSLNLFVGASDQRVFQFTSYAAPSRREWLEKEAARIVSTFQWREGTAASRGQDLGQAPPDRGLQPLLKGTPEELEKLKKLEAAFTSGNTRDAGTLEQIARARNAAGDAAGALKWIETGKSLVSQTLSLQALRARLLRGRGMTVPAMEAYRQVFGSGFADEDGFQDYLNLLLETKLKTSAVQAVEEFARAHPSSRARRWQAMVYAQAGDSARAIEMLQKLTAEKPFDHVSALKLGELANEVRRFDIAANATAALIKEGHDTPRTRLIMGYSQLGQGRADLAAEAFERARRLNPADPQVARALASLPAATQAASIAALAAAPPSSGTAGSTGKKPASPAPSAEKTARNDKKPR